jgi:pilus assembly protein Flp/PilA
MRTILKLSQAKTIALAKAKEGVTAIEYGLIAGFIALTIIGGISAFGTKLNSFFQTMTTTLQNAAAGSDG